MKFLHTGDTHLGASNYKLKEREDDFMKAFEQLIEIAIREKVEFIVHSGDLFDVGTPNHSTVIKCVEQLKRLKEAKIPVFIIPGSHDMHLDSTIITLLEAVGLVTNLAHKRYREIKDGKLMLSGEVYNNVFMCGIEGRRANIKKVFENLEINWPEKHDYSIFLFHHTISSVSTMEGYMDIPTSYLPKNFDYYAAGHVHAIYDKDKIHYPGSIEYCSLTEVKSGEKKYANIIENDELRKVEIKTRKIIRKELNVKGMSPEEVNKECMKQIMRGEGELLIIELKGRLREGTKGEVNKIQINNEAIKNGYLHCAVYLKDLENPEQKTINKKTTIEEIEEEHLKSRGYKDDEITKAKTILQVMGRKMKTNEVALAIKELEELLG